MVFYKPQRGQTPRRRQAQGNADLAEDTEEERQRGLSARHFGFLD